MSEIHLLDSNTIDKIAAGEVVENPASIVKELVENSMDSGANNITVEIKSGGIEYIRVTDNGTGISKDNIKKAFLRHATSKINSIDDLFIIKSMGFRGEALASISAVSKVELISKTEDSLMGNRYVIEGSKETEFEEIGAPKGTTIIVRNLFYNTPARRKFLKSDTSEGANVSDVMQNLSMCRPDISFNYIVNGKVKISTSGNNDLKEIIYRLYGRDMVKEIIPIDTDINGIKVKGYLGHPSQNRPTRNYETYFINNRFIKSKDIFSGIEDGYKAYTMQHKFPFCVLHFNINTENIDINVHPQKKELRFLNRDNLTKLISDAVSDTLNNHEMIKSVKITKDDNNKSEIIQKTPEPFEENRIADNQLIQNTDDITKNENNSVNDSFKGYIDDIAVFSDDENSDVNASDEEFNSYNSIETSIKDSIKDSIKESAKKSLVDAALSIAKYYDEIVVDKTEQINLFENEKFVSENSRKEYKIIGQIFNTYWIIELKDKIYFIDQHAAHEKVNYERLMKRVRDNKPVSQMLNPPVIVTLTPNDKNILENNISYFNALGFEIEDMGLNEIGIRAVPLELYFNSPKEMLEEVISELSKNTAKDTPDSITSKVATMACKASVKGGMSMNFKEIEALLDELLLLDNPYHCPHGRPTMFSMSQYELEKKFMRIVN